jgi:hypothetical protein
MGALFPTNNIIIPETQNTVKPPAEITKTREIIDIILNNHENRPLFIEKNLFSQSLI